MPSLVMKKSSFLCFVFFVFLLSSCNSIYMPNVPATPMFTEKGQAYVSGHISLKGNISGNAGIALSDHVAVIASGSSIDNGEYSNRYFRQWLTEGAVGYFTKIGKRKNQILEIYGGYGFGKTNDLEQRSSIEGFQVVGTKELNFTKQFVQVNYSSTKIGKINLFGLSQPIHYGTAIRLSRVSTNNFMINNVEQNHEENLFVEPVFFTGMPLFKGFQIQYATGFNFGLIKNKNLKAGNSIFTLGVSYNFGNK